MNLDHFISQSLQEESEKITLPKSLEESIRKQIASEAEQVEKKSKIDYRRWTDGMLGGLVAAVIVLVVLIPMITFLYPNEQMKDMTMSLDKGSMNVTTQAPNKVEDGAVEESAKKDSANYFANGTSESMDPIVTDNLIKKGESYEVIYSFVGYEEPVPDSKRIKVQKGTILQYEGEGSGGWICLNKENGEEIWMYLDGIHESETGMKILDILKHK